MKRSWIEAGSRIRIEFLEEETPSGFASFAVARREMQLGLCISK